MFGNNNWNNNERKKQQQELKQQQTAYQVRLTRGLFRSAIKWTEKYVEIAYPNDFPNWQARKQIHADEIKRTDIVDNPKKVEKFLSTALYGLDGDTDNLEILDELRTNFYEWIDAVGIDPNTCPERLKHFLVGFHEILEGNGEKINKDALNRVFEIDLSSQEYADIFANSFIGVQTHLQNERKVEKSLEGKNWKEMENENKFNGNAERGKWILEQIARNHDYKDFYFWPQKSRQIRNPNYKSLIDDPSEEFLKISQWEEKEVVGYGYDGKKCLDKALVKKGVQLNFDNETGYPLFNPETMLQRTQFSEEVWTEIKKQIQEVSQISHQTQTSRDNRPQGGSGGFGGTATWGFASVISIIGLVFTR